MNINDLLAQTGGLASMARELGINQQQAAQGAQALLPAIMVGFKKQAQAQPEGFGALGGLLGQLGGGGLLDSVLSPEPTDVGRGNNVLGQIFGSKDVSRTVAQSAAAKSGLDPSLLRKMLPMLAMMAAGYMAKQQGGAPAGNAVGGLGGLLGGLLGGGQPQQQSGGGLGGLAALLDADGDGNPLDDILGMAQKMMR
ncbi:MAG: DUF937 domain-containing protein [Ahniella sp.]|nr:DUF937 domain-containing protein [Ahniella sp.]